MMSRRLFVAGAGAAIAVPCPAIGAGRAGLEPWLRCFTKLDAAARIGSHLHLGVGYELSSTCARSLERLNRLTGDASPELLTRIIAQEFRRGQTMQVQGVVLSQTEVLLYAHAYRENLGG